MTQIPDFKKLAGAGWIPRWHKDSDWPPESPDVYQISDSLNTSFRPVIGEQMIDVLGPEKRRRRTTISGKDSVIVQQSFEPGMTVSLVARQHGVAASRYFWRKAIP